MGDELKKQLALAQSRSARYKKARAEAERLLEQKSRELFDANQELEAAHSALEDDIRQATYELSVTNKRLQKALNERSAFIGQMSHEVRTPLNAIIGLSEILLTTRLDEAQLDYIDTINSGAKSLIVLLNDMLDITKIEAGRVDIDPQPEQSHRLHKNLVAMFALQAKELGLRLNLRLADSVPNVIRIDRGRYKQIINNLISNALKNTKRGEVSVNVGYEPDTVSDGTGTLIVKVIDTGIGIPEDQLKRIFNAYEQIGRPNQGVGLGLAICQQLSELMMGSIRCESTVGTGSVFELKLPVEQLPDEFEPSDRRPTVVSASLPNLRILVAEDNPTNQKVLTAQLSQLGQRAEIVNNGAEAIEKLQVNDYDVVILDILMPVMDGEDTLKTIRASERRIAQHHCIALTASSYQDQRDRLLKLGFDAFLSKPLGLAELSVALNEVPAGRCVTQDMEPITALNEASTKQLSDNADAFDYTYLKTQFGDAYKAIFKEIAPSFLTHAYQELEDLKTFSEQALSEKIERTSHSMKGAASSVGLSELANLLLKIESQPDSSEVSGWVTQVDQLMQRLKPVIEREIASRD